MLGLRLTTTFRTGIPNKQEMPMIYNQQLAETKTQLAAANASITAAADTADRQGDEELRNWLLHVGDQIEEVLDCVRYTLAKRQESDAA
jgi:hypothetical protein